MGVQVSSTLHMLEDLLAQDQLHGIHHLTPGDHVSLRSQEHAKTSSREKGFG